MLRRRGGYPAGTMSALNVRWFVGIVAVLAVVVLVFLLLADLWS